MRKQCLFDPNHLIDEFGYTKHLLNCQSKLKKDWRKCRYSDSHWHLYKYIDFHQNYECPYNPLYVQNPQKFVQERNKQIRKRMSQAKQKNQSKSQNILSSLHQDSRITSIVEPSLHDPDQSMNFGQISIIEKSKNYKSDNQNLSLSKSKNLQNLIITDLHEVLEMNETMNDCHDATKISTKYQTEQTISSTIKLEVQSNFESEIFKKEKELWNEPNFEIFQKKFRQKWVADKEKINEKQENEEQKKEESFQEQDQDEITIGDIHLKYLEIDQD